MSSWMKRRSMTGATLRSELTDQPRDLVSRRGVDAIGVGQAFQE
jgi:hypothetical protein